MSDDQARVGSGMVTLRDDASLLVFFISDEDEQSGLETGALVQRVFQPDQGRW